MQFQLERLVEQIPQGEMRDAIQAADELSCAIFERLCESPVVVGNAEWETLADRAMTAMSELYQHLLAAYPGEKL